MEGIDICSKEVLKKVNLYQKIPELLREYFTKNKIDQIPKLLLCKDSEVQYIIRNYIFFNFKNPFLWKELKDLLLSDPYSFYSIPIESLLKSIKYSIDMKNINMNVSYIPISKKYDAINISKRLRYDTKLFDEFSKYIDSKFKHRYSKDEKLFMFTTLLTEDEIKTVLPSYKPKRISNNELKSSLSKSTDSLSDKNLLVISQSDINLLLLKKVLNCNINFIKYTSDNESIILNGINSKKYDLLITIVDNIKDSIINFVIKEKISRISTRIFRFKHNESIPVMLVNKNNFKMYIENIVDVLKSNIQVKFNIIKNNVDMSDKASLLQTIDSWDELFNNYLSKKEWVLGTTQYFYHEYEFKKKLALLVLKNIETNERIYVNCKNLDYIYYTADWNYQKEGIKPLEKIDKLTKRSIKIEDYMNSYGTIKGYEKPQLFESDIPVADKLSQYAKEYATYIAKLEQPERIIDIDPKIAYIDIEVYMDEGFEQPTSATKEINSIAYSFSDSTHIDIYILDKNNEINFTEHEIINSFLNKAKQDVSDFSKKKKGLDTLNERISQYTYKVIRVSTEYELLKALEERIVQDQPDILTSWNAWFDFNYIINRCRYMNYSDITLSPLRIRGYISSSTGLYKAPGVDILDSLELYKQQKSGELRSSKLGYVGQLEIGLNKIEYEGDLYSLYDNSKEKFCAYNIFDVLILKEIDLMKQMFVQNCFYRQATGCSIESVSSTLRSSDTVCIEYARRLNLCVRNHTGLISKNEKYKGALTIVRKPNLHYIVVDLDQTSQYPSIMRTFNIAPNTFKLKINVDQDILYRYIHEGYLSKEDSERDVEVILDPLVWYGGNTLGIKAEVNLSDLLNRIKELKYILTTTGAVFLNHEQELGFFYILLTNFKKNRDKFKSLMKKYYKEGNYVLRDIYNKRQLTEKILQNSLYGATGTDYFRFFHKDIAETITTQARTEISLVAYNLDVFIKQWIENMKEKR